MESFGCAMTDFFEVKDMVLISFWTFCCYLLVALQSLTHLYHVLIISLGSFQYCKLCFRFSTVSIASEGMKFDIFHEHVAYFHAIFV